MGDVIQRDFGGLAQIHEQGAGPRPCRHRSTIVDEVARTVVCSTCGAPLDPITVLLEYARKERHWRNWTAEMLKTQSQLKQLQTEVVKAKARLKYALRKDAAVAVAEEHIRTERMRLQITELARDIGRSCRRIEQLAKGRT